jgi:hypothetical protein
LRTYLRNVPQPARSDPCTVGGVNHAIRIHRLTRHGSRNLSMPTTSFNVQAWFDNGVPEDDSEMYETVKCLICSRLHLVNRKTGKVLGEE